MGDKIVKLPEREEMLRRLIKMNDSWYLQEKFYPIVLEYADQEKNAVDIVDMIISSVCKFAVDDRDANPGIIPAARAIRIVNASGVNLVNALVDYPGIVTEAKKFFAG